MAGGRITIDIPGSTTYVQGLPDGMALHWWNRPGCAKNLSGTSRPDSLMANSACHLLLTSGGEVGSSNWALLSRSTR